MKIDAGTSSREKILSEATRIAQAHGYNGLNIRELADAVGIKAASIYHHFASKADLGAAVAKRYWEDSEAALLALQEEFGEPARCLRQYPDTFRAALTRDNRICLASFMGAETDDLPEEVTREVRSFADVNVAWLKTMLIATATIPASECEDRARAIFAAIAGAQLIARSRTDISLYDRLIDGYRTAGLLPS